MQKLFLRPPPSILHQPCTDRNSAVLHLFSSSMLSTRLSANAGRDENSYLERDLRVGLRDFREQVLVGGSSKVSTSSDDRSPPFDLCPIPASKINKLNGPTLFDMLRGMFLSEPSDLNAALPEKRLRLRPGMVLLAGFLSHKDQVAIVKICRDLGVGSGRFCQLELGLRMMCLGKHWNPVANRYEKKRSTDGAVPIQIPDVFEKLVERAIQASHDLIKQKIKGRPEDEMPGMSPDVCIVEFCSNTGRLRLHQHKYESKDSICKALPVVMFSIGDAADFLYGERNDGRAAESVFLGSGDVLVYGGRSRFLYHRISKVHHETTPKSLVNETNLRPGHLSLTFKQY